MNVKPRFRKADRLKETGFFILTKNFFKFGIDICMKPYYNIICTISY